MPSRDLPARPHLDHLKNEAKALQKAFAQGEAGAIERARAVLGDTPSLKLTDAQRVIAREHGFPTWARLREQVRSSRGPDEVIAEFLAAVQEQDRARAARVVRAHPRLASESLHVASALGDEKEARRLIGADPSLVRSRTGNPAGEPLLFLCYSPFHGESSERDAALLATARTLLDAGADPNTVDGRYEVPALYAVTGVRSVLPVARLLLERGANPTDGESVFHAAEHFHEEALELLLRAGADLNYVGEWGNTALWFLLRWWNLEEHTRVKQGLVWLLDHGADPNVRSGTERESALHVAVARGQSPATIRLLLDHGADVNARREDGSTPWLLARRGGFEEVATLLEDAGATTQPLSPADQLLEACGRGDVASARLLGSPELLSKLEPPDRLLMVDAASSGRWATTLTCLAAGFPVNAQDGNGSTALHYAAIRGNTAVAHALLQAGADFNVRDKEHSSTPLGWATFGSDHVRESPGDYEGTVRALLEAGARPRSDEYYPQSPGLRKLLREFKPS